MSIQIFNIEKQLTELIGRMREETAAEKSLIAIRDQQRAIPGAKNYNEFVRRVNRAADRFNGAVAKRKNQEKAFRRACADYLVEG